MTKAMIGAVVLGLNATAAQLPSPDATIPQVCSLPANRSLRADAIPLKSLMPKILTVLSSSSCSVPKWMACMMAFMLLSTHPIANIMSG